MPVTKVQGKTGESNPASSSFSLTFDSQPRTGSTIVACANIFDEGGGGATGWDTVTDTGGNTYSLGSRLWGVSDSDALTMATSVGIATADPFIVTFTASAGRSGKITATITELSGVSGFAGFTDNGGTSDTPSVGAANTKPIWAVVAHNGSGLTISQAANYTLDGEIESPTNGRAINTEYKLAGPTTAAAWSLSGSAGWAALAGVVNETPFIDPTYSQPPLMWPTPNVVSYGSY